MGVSVQVIITNHDLAFIGDMRDDPGDELQIIHRLPLSAVLTVPVADFSLGLQE
jgi:hypothetical protein